MTIRVAAIGHGDIARRRHLPELAGLGERARLVALAGTDAGRLAETAARFPGAALSTDAMAVIHDPGVDAVLVLTPPDTHAAFAEAALRAGKHVLIEKPMVRDRAEAARLLAAHAAAPRPVVAMALPFVETPDHRLVADLLAAGAIGAVTSVECHRGHRGPTHASWFYRRAEAGGGVLADLGIYHLSTVAALLGPARRMAGTLTTRFATRVMDDGSVVSPDVEDGAVVTLTLADGSLAVVHAHWNGGNPHQQTRARVLLVGREGLLHFGAADRAIHVHRSDGDYSMLPAGAEAGEYDSLPCRTLRAPGAEGPPAIVAAFLDRIAAGETSARSLALQAHILDVIATAYEAPGNGVVGSAF